MYGRPNSNLAPKGNIDALPNFPVKRLPAANWPAAVVEANNTAFPEWVSLSSGRVGLTSFSVKRFTVRKMSDGIGVERIFPLESPAIDSIVVNKYGKVRRAKLYYLRKLTGKKARIKERRVASL